MEAECGKSSIAWKVQVLLKTELEQEERSRNETSQMERSLTEKLSPKALDSSHSLSRSGNRGS